MIKNVLTALFIAGLSAMAQAEQWLCKGEEADILRHTLHNPKIYSVSFVLVIDREQKSVKLKGDVSGENRNDPNYFGGAVTFGDGYVLRASNWYQTISLEDNGYMVRTFLGTAASPYVLVTFAKCQKI